MFDLVHQINENANSTRLLIESCKLTGYNVDNICEAADRWLGRVLTSLRHGKNPFDTIPGSKEIVAGLLLLNNPDNREALNIDDSKFDAMAQELERKEGFQKYLSRIAKRHAPSLIDNLQQHVEDSNKREVLIKKLTKLQQRFSNVKQQAGTTPGLTKTRSVNKLS